MPRTLGRSQVRALCRRARAVQSAAPVAEVSDGVGNRVSTRPRRFQRAAAHRQARPIQIRELSTGGIRILQATQAQLPPSTRLSITQRRGHSGGGQSESGVARGLAKIGASPETGSLSDSKETSGAGEAYRSAPCVPRYPIEPSLEGLSRFDRKEAPQGPTSGGEAASGIELADRDLSRHRRKEV